MLIQYKDLEVGDVIIIPSNSHFRCLKIVSLPKPNSTTFRCTRYMETVNFPGTKYQTEKFNLDTTQHNNRVSVNLGYKDIWLISREQ